MKTGIENKKLLELILELRKAEKDIWKKVAKELSKPTRRRPAVTAKGLPTRRWKRSSATAARG